ncbi:MAG: hypothetical protein HZY76_00855 [Anaerolineae bacterium]|nr:MAG: hypothetical protein HZY76_00855 [Anaerolineae bacterium]
MAALLGLPGWVVFLLLFGSSLVGALVGMLFLVVLVFVVGLLLGPRVMAPIERTPTIDSPAHTAMPL